MGVASRARRHSRPGLAERRTLAGAAGAVVGLAIALVAGASWRIGVLAAWDGAALVFTALVARSVGHLDGDATAGHAQSEDDSNRASGSVLLAASTASLVAVGLILVQAGHEHGAARIGLTALALGSVALSWACAHMVYMLRYARLYYTAPVGGLSFAESDRPDYVDFAYVALTIGMTFQVSDTAISKRGVRRAAIHHALLSYQFGAVILAIAINAVAGLVGR